MYLSSEDLSHNDYFVSDKLSKCSVPSVIVVIIVKIYIYTYTVYTHKSYVSTLYNDLSDYCHNKSYRQFKSTSLIIIYSLKTSGRDVYCFMVILNTAAIY